MCVTLNCLHKCLSKSVDCCSLKEPKTSKIENKRIKCKTFIWCLFKKKPKVQRLAKTYPYKSKKKVKTFIKKGPKINVFVVKDFQNVQNLNLIMRCATAFL